MGQLKTQPEGVLSNPTWPEYLLGGPELINPQRIKKPYLAQKVAVFGRKTRREANIGWAKKKSNNSRPGLSKIKKLKTRPDGQKIDPTHP